MRTSSPKDGPVSLPPQERAVWHLLYLTFPCLASSSSEQLILHFNFPGEVRFAYTAINNSHHIHARLQLTG